MSPSPFRPVIPHNSRRGHEGHACAISPVDDFFALGPYEVLLVGGQDAQRVLLAGPGLPVDDVGALVHVDGALRQSAGLRGHNGDAELADVPASRSIRPPTSPPPHPPTVLLPRLAGRAR